MPLDIQKMTEKKWPRGSRNCIFMLLQHKGNTDWSSADARGATDFFMIFASCWSKIEFLCISNHFSDFSGLDLMFAEAHARGFAPL